MDIKEQRAAKGGQGNAAAEYSDYVARAGNWAMGADARFNDIVHEAAEEDQKFGVVNQNTDSNANEFQYGNRGPEQHAVKIVGGK
jgi:hypothetical protein